MAKREDNRALFFGGVALAALYVLGRVFGTEQPVPYPMPEGQTPTLNASQLRLLVDRIFGAIYGDGSFWSGATAEDEAAVVDALTVPRNDADVVALINAWGIRGGRWSTAGDLTLPATVREYLSPSDIADINAGFAQRGITFTF